MAPPKGMKYALGCTTGGRPSKYNLDKEAEDLLRFVSKDDCLALEDFTHTKPYLASELCEFARRSDNFSAALKKAKEIIGRRREHMVSTGKMNYGVWYRSARLYSKILMLDEENVKDLDMERKMKLIDHEVKKRAETASTITEDFINQYKGLMNQLSALQSNRNIADNKIKDATKS